MDGIEEEELFVEDESLCLSKGKKRRLNIEQVRALERSFELDNKLDPERKMRMAQELELEPRQVAVWFQNRRARWKNKRLERDYSTLKSQYDLLREKHDVLLRDKEILISKIEELKAKLGEDDIAMSMSSVKEKNKASDEPLTLIYKDGSSDSDSSAVITDSSAITATTINSTSGFKEAISDSIPLSNSDSRLCHHKEKFGQQMNPFFMIEECDEFVGGDDTCLSFLINEEQSASFAWCYTNNWN